MFESARERLSRLDALLLAWGPLVLVVFALCYYGQYYRSDLNLGGEGGTIAVNAMRLNEGWLPIKDTTLNYNLLWFYPVAWLFQITGPDYVALRVYFFALCLLAGWLAFLIVRRVSGHGWYALGVGLVVLAIPGMMFRNYMGLLAVANALVLLHAFVLAPRRAGERWMWFAVAGLVFGLTWLVRIDIALFFAVIYLGLVVLYPPGVRGEFLRRLPVALGGGLLCLFVAVAVHVPFYLDAQKRGFAAEFVGDYLTKWSFIKYEAQKKLFRAPQASTAPAPEVEPFAGPQWAPVRFQKAEPNWAQIEKKKRWEQQEAERKGRPRQELRDLSRQASFYDAVFILILYLPIPISLMIAAAAGLALVWAILKRDASVKEASLVCLVTLGSALVLFPQYFFFRPDTPHLSEFMIPFVVAMACAVFFAVKVACSMRSRTLRAALVGFVAVCVVAEGLYFYHSFRKESAGTIAAARKRDHEMTGQNGVRVWLKRREKERIQAMHDLIVSHSAPDEWVVTFPYSPTINFMTNRRSYLKDLYIDNATAGPRFTQEKVAEIERFRPAVIVIDQRAINDTENSRFKNWAAPTYDYIRRHYVRIPGEFDTNEIYVRPDKIPPQT